MSSTLCTAAFPAAHIDSACDTCSNCSAEQHPSATHHSVGMLQTWQQNSIHVHGMPMQASHVMCMETTRCHAHGQPDESPTDESPTAGRLQALQACSMCAIWHVHTQRMHGQHYRAYGNQEPCSLTLLHCQFTANLPACNNVECTDAGFSRVLHEPQQTTVSCFLIPSTASCLLLQSSPTPSCFLQTTFHSKCKVHGRNRMLCMQPLPSLQWKETWWSDQFSILVTWEATKGS